MKLAPAARLRFDALKTSGRAYSDVLIYCAVDLDGIDFRPSVSNTQRFALNRLETPEAWAKHVSPLVKTKKPAAFNEILCASLAELLFSKAFRAAPPTALPGVLACAKIILALPIPPELGSGAIAGLLAFALRSKKRSPELEKQLAQLHLEPFADGRVPFDSQFTKLKRKDLFLKLTSNQ